MKKRIMTFLLTIFVGTGFLTACGGEEVGNQEESIDTKVVETLRGEVEIPVNPERIVDISGSSEALLALGITPVATADGDAYATDRLPAYLIDMMRDVKIVGYHMQGTMDLEGILAADPDLILMSERQEKLYDQLSAIAPVVMMKNFDNDWRDRLTYIGELFDKAAAGAEWLAEHDKTAAAFGEKIREANGTDKTYLSILTSADGFFVFADGGVGSLLYDDLGLQRPANLPEQDGVSLPVVTIEGLAQIEADHIVVVSTEEEKANLENNSVWQAMSAVKDGEVTFLPSSPTFTQAYQIIGRKILLETLATALTN